MLFWRLQRDPTLQEPGRVDPEVGQYLQIQFTWPKNRLSSNIAHSLTSRRPGDFSSKWKVPTRNQ